MSYRISVDTGGTFTDVVVVDADGGLHVAKALTTYARAFDGIRSSLSELATQFGLEIAGLLAQTTHFAYGTTRATNAIVEGKTACTALFTTAGFPDVLLLREGGKIGPFTPREFSPPYVPRYLTFEIAERVDSDGGVFRALDEESVVDAIAACRKHGVEAVAVMLLWSTVNPLHELRVGELLAEHLPEVAVTLSHALNPIVREYRRASSAAIDASLKPVMQRFLGELEADLRTAGFAGQLLISTSYGGAWPTSEMVARPIYSVGSGPSMAPVAALECARTELSNRTPDLLVCDTGGTTFDVSLISSGQIHHATDMWLGERWSGHITGTKAVDVRSIGAGGGSIVAVDTAGLLRVGPNSAGADPGPASYGNGGTLPTITDAALILGYLDPDGFVSGRLRLDARAARAAFVGVAGELERTIEEAARGALVVATQNVVSAIREITIAQGIDPRDLAIVAGGGASGLNIVQVARELGCRNVIVPRTAGVLSAVGALQAAVISEFAANCFAESAHFDHTAVNLVLAANDARAQDFAAQIAVLEPHTVSITAAVDARYPGQVWELETPLATTHIRDQDDVAALEAAFHKLHERVFAVSDPDQQVECITWRVRVTAELDQPTLAPPKSVMGSPVPLRTRGVLFAQAGLVETPIYDGQALAAGAELAGPAVIIEPTTTLVIDPGASVRMSNHGAYMVDAETSAVTPVPSNREVSA